MTLWEQKWVARAHGSLTVAPLSPSVTGRLAFFASPGTNRGPEHPWKESPVKKAAYRIAAKLRLIDAERLTRPYIYY
ncbi:cittilin family RiPP precursor [Nocardiopsis sp. CC223A]|uniref:cittilin family RiPP precursor n=1 Tax=Nocardiopsis sp. CC223A TaxID=3044051 RepID=UPI002796036C|nr:cittilin family RiPP precursor [Nocardiopsis sp. CC223A]